MGRSYVIRDGSLLCSYPILEFSIVHSTFWMIFPIAYIYIYSTKNQAHLWTYEFILEYCLFLIQSATRLHFKEQTPRGAELLIADCQQFPEFEVETTNQNMFCTQLIFQHFYFKCIHNKCYNLKYKYKFLEYSLLRRIQVAVNSYFRHLFKSFLLTHSM